MNDEAKKRAMAIYVRKFSMGKKCKLCNGPVCNLAKVFTCQPCRAKQAQARPRRKRRFL